MKPEEFISALRESDQYIEIIFMNGGCFQFFLLLQKFFPDAEPYVEKFHRGHVVSMIDGEMYDVRGRLEYWKQETYVPLIGKELLDAGKWSFHKHNLLKITECPACEEPMTV